MKIYIAYTEGDDVAKHMDTKMTIPKSWRSGPVSKLLDFVVETYNSKHADNLLEAASVHLERDEKAVGSADIVEEVMSKSDRIVLKPGASIEHMVKPAPGAFGSGSAPAAAAGPNPNEGKLRCKNFNCGKFFTEEENHDGACTHHAKPPYFHECKKGWSCCKDIVAYDWEEFQAIPGCVTTRHSTEDPGKAIALSDAQEEEKRAKEEAAAQATKPKLNSIEKYNDSNPEASTGAKSFGANTGANAKPKVVKYEDGTYKCHNKSCGMKFNPDDNHATACMFHTGAPVFHETYKWWGCCPKQKKFEFDEFMNVPGCRMGPHWNGEGEGPEGEAVGGGEFEAGEDGAFDLN